MGSFSSLYLIITRVHYVLVCQLMFWVILLLLFLVGILWKEILHVCKLKKFKQINASSFFFFLVFSFRIQRAFACNLFHLVKHLANDFSGFLINIIGIYNVVNMYKPNEVHCMCFTVCLWEAILVPLELRGAKNRSAKFQFSAWFNYLLFT